MSQHDEPTDRSAADAAPSRQPMPAHDPVAAAEAHLRNVDLSASREALKNLTKGPIRR
jgi:hypothetical protein